MKTADFLLPRIFLEILSEFISKQKKYIYLFNILKSEIEKSKENGSKRKSKVLSARISGRIHNFNIIWSCLSIAFCVKRTCRLCCSSALCYKGNTVNSVYRFETYENLDLWEQRPFRKGKGRQRQKLMAQTRLKHCRKQLFVEYAKASGR